MGVVALADGVFRIPTAGDYINSFAFVESDGSVTLVDTGMRWAGGTIRRGLAEIGRHPSDVQRIVLTHAHGDHVGSAAALVETTAASGVAVHRADAQYVRDGSPPPGSGFGRVLQRLPGFGFKPVAASRELADGDVLDVGGGLEVHHTPGHTPGHVSLRHRDSGVLITGDVIFNMAGRMTWPVRAFCTDFPLNRRSASVLADLDYRVAAFTHGPHIGASAREVVRGFLRRDGVVS
jgi:glyoxylase-like metal-dependent hydrolase (beta-lactamase superfamily II)